MRRCRGKKLLSCYAENRDGSWLWFMCGGLCAPVMDTWSRKFNVPSEIGVFGVYELGLRAPLSSACRHVSLT
jgi:hypothetical protein